jgi:hypothetical protein
MSKKLFISLAPVLAIAALAVLPTGAGAVEYYKNSFPAGKLAEGEKLPVLAWGTLTLTSNLPSKASPSSCENSSGGFVQNTGGKGNGATDNFASWNCTNAGCPPGKIPVPFPPGEVEKEFIVFAGPEIPTIDSPGTGTYAGGSLPWPNELTGTSTENRTESKHVVVVLGCIAQKISEANTGGNKNLPQFLASPTVCFTTPANKQEPIDANGSNFGPSQSKLTFDKNSGHLLCKGPAEPQVEPGEEIVFEGNTSGSLHAMGYKASEIVISK